LNTNLLIYFNKLALPVGMLIQDNITQLVAQA